MDYFAEEMGDDFFSKEVGGATAVEEKEPTANLAQAAQAGLMKGGARNIKDVGNVVQMAGDALPSYTPLGFLGKMYQKLPVKFEDIGNDALDYVEKQIPKREGVVAKLVEGAFQVPSAVAELVALKGVHGGLPAQMAIQGAAQGYDNRKASESLWGAGAGALMGTALTGIGMIKPAAKGSKILEKMGGLASGKMKEVAAQAPSKLTEFGFGATRAGLSAGLGAGSAAASGEEGDEIAAQAILFGYLGAKPNEAPSWWELGNASVGKIKNVLLKVAEPRLRERAIAKAQRSLTGELSEARGVISEIGAQEAKATSKVTEKAKAEDSMLGVEESGRIEFAKSLGEAETKKYQEEGIQREMQRLAEEKAVEIQTANKLHQISEEAGLAIKAKAKELQPTLIENFKGHGEKYGKIQDRIADDIDSKEPIKIGEAVEILKSAKSESVDDADIQGGKALSKMIELLNGKYNLGNDQNNPRLNAKGEREILSEDTTIPFKEFLSDVRSVFGTAKYGQRARAEDIPAWILRAKFGDWLDARDTKGEFRALNGAYKQAVSYMKTASKMFSVYKGEADTVAPEGVLRLLAGEKSGYLAGSQERTLNFIEKGSPMLGKGLGDVFSQFKGYASQKASVKAGETQAKEAIGSKYTSLSEKSRSNYEKNLGEITQKIDSITRDIDAKKQSLKNASQKEKEAIASDFQKQVQTIGERINAIEARKSQLRGDVVQLERLRAKHSALKKLLVGVTAVGAFTAVGAARIAASRALNALTSEVRQLD